MMDTDTRAFYLQECNAKLLEALEDLVEAIPGQTNDRDWWPDELTKAVAQAKSLLERYQ